MNSSLNKSGLVSGLAGGLMDVPNRFNHGNSMLLNGSSQYAATASNDTTLNGLTELTMMAWVQRNGSPSKLEVICGKGSASSNWTAIALGGTGIFLGGCYGVLTGGPGNQTYGKAGVCPNVGEWYHICMVFIGGVSGLRIYVNGIDVKSVFYASDAAVHTSVTASTSPIYLGTTSYSVNTSNVQGGIDDARIYSKALEPSDILKIYKMGRGGIGHPNNLLHRFSFDTEGIYTRNSGSTANHLTLTGSPTFINHKSFI